MKIGDLVALSAYGKKRKRASWIEPDDVGIIIKVKHWASNYPPDYRVMWRKSRISKTWMMERDNARRDLRYAK